MEVLNWKELLYPYEQAMSELVIKLKFIMNEYKLLDMYTPMESVKGRVKNPASIIEKANKKNIPLDKIEEELEDIAGVRIICQFVEDIPKVIALIRRRDGHDLTIVRERDYIANSKPSGYRSYHIIVRYPVSSVSGYKEVLAEIQIRTLAMNFWAVTEHSLKYKYSGNIPKEVQDRLVSCAEAAFNLDNEMSTIRNEITYANKVNQIKDGVIAEISDKIQMLYSRVRLSEMEGINKEFVDLWSEGTIEELKEFRDKLSDMTNFYEV